MLRKILVLSAVAATVSVLDAAAAARPDAAPPVRPAVEGIQLAQGRDVEVYYDRRGRRVIVDAYTGEILAVQRPRNGEQRRVQRRAWREQQQERFYLDNPEDMARLERLKRQEAGRLAPPVDDDSGYRPIYPDDEDAFPEAPRGVYREAPDDDSYQDEADEPRVVRRQPVERAPLDDDSPNVKRAPKAQPADAAEETAEASPGTTIIEEPAVLPPALTARDDVAGLQVLLDRKGASPGVIDGRFGSNVDKAIIAYRSITGENLKSTDSAAIKAALAASGGDAFTTYTISATDAAGPYVASVPADYGEKAKLERMSFTSVPEMLAEKFHMDEAYLKALNPGVNFGRPGSIIKVANIGQPVGKPVTRIVADKTAKQVRAYDSAGKLVAAYPATIGSEDTPSPTGIHKVSRVAFDPEYTYNPNLNFKQGENSKILTIPPGPNGPVGSIWIALDKPTYGIHGTPDPSKIGKTESHGCVRLTNWDAAELAKLVKAEVPVEFVD